jgi:hypothetical protein
MQNWQQLHYGLKSMGGYLHLRKVIELPQLLLLQGPILMYWHGMCKG